MKYMKEVVCEICGVTFLGGSNASACPYCSPIYRRTYFALMRIRKLIGDGSRAALRAEAIKRVRTMRKKSAPVSDLVPAQWRARCGYCGRELGPRDARRGYCTTCVAQGLHWLHEVTGRTAEGRP